MDRFARRAHCRRVDIVAAAHAIVAAAVNAWARFMWLSVSLLARCFISFVLRHIRRERERERGAFSFVHWKLTGEIVCVLHLHRHRLSSIASSSSLPTSSSSSFTLSTFNTVPLTGECVYLARNANRPPNARFWIQFAHLVCANQFQLLDDDDDVGVVVVVSSLNCFAQNARSALNIVCVSPSLSRCYWLVHMDPNTCCCKWNFVFHKFVNI